MEIEGALIILVCVIAMIFLGGMYAGKVELKHQALEHGYALYCPDTGEFSWKDECGEEKVK